MRAYDPEVWAEIMAGGSLNLQGLRDISIEITPNNLTGEGVLILNSRYGGTFTARVESYLREYGWFLPYVVEVKIPRMYVGITGEARPNVGRNAPSTQAVAGYIQSALLHAERAYTNNPREIV